MPRTFSGKIFDRPVDDTRPVSKALGDELAKMCLDEETIVRALGANLECDWRVSEQREAEFFAMFGSSSPDMDGPKSVQSKLRDYFKKYIRGTNEPHFDSDSNIDNWNRDLEPATVLVNAYTVPLVPKAIERALNSVAQGTLRSEEDCRRALGNVFPHGSSPGTSFVTTLEAGQRTFLGELFSFLNPSGEPVRHPVWAGLWDGLTASVVEMGPDAWLAAQGVQNTERALCLLFRYRREDKNLFRPTYLDSSACSEHFPSPSHAARWTGAGSAPHGGHPMSLMTATDCDPILQEFIHRDFARSPEMVYAWGWTSGGAGSKDLEDGRRDHYGRLTRYYTGLDRWLAEPI